MLRALRGHKEPEPVEKVLSFSGNYKGVIECDTMAPWHVIQPEREGKSVISKSRYSTSNLPDDK